MTTRWDLFKSGLRIFLSIFVQKLKQIGWSCFKLNDKKIRKNGIPAAMRNLKKILPALRVLAVILRYHRAGGNKSQFFTHRELIIRSAISRYCSSQWPFPDMMKLMESKRRDSARSGLVRRSESSTLDALTILINFERRGDEPYQMVEHRARVPRTHTPTLPYTLTPTLHFTATVTTVTAVTTVIFCSPFSRDWFPSDCTWNFDLRLCRAVLASFGVFAYLQVSPRAHEMTSSLRNKIMSLTPPLEPTKNANLKQIRSTHCRFIQLKIFFGIRMLFPYHIMTVSGVWHFQNSIYSFWQFVTIYCGIYWRIST
jgi:hypothetical protein